MGNNTNTTDTEDFFLAGWFKYSKDVDVNYGVIETLYNLIVIVSLPLNLIFLAMIIKNPGKKTWAHTSIILGNMTLMNLVANSITTVNQVDIIYREDQVRFISNEVIVCVISMSIIMYYGNAFLLALNTYAMIVKPLLYKAKSPRPRTTVFITLILLLAAGSVFFLLFVDDHVDIIQTFGVAFSWVTTLAIVVMYAQILSTLRRRKRDLQNTLNAAASRQGLLVIKQNSKLAAVLLVYIIFIVLMSQPIGICMFLLINCPPCDDLLTLKMILYLILPSMLMPVLFPVHWLLGTPQYYRELKRLGSKLFTCSTHCRH